jgi:hypothetical protein
VLGRIRLDLGAVERNVPELHQSSFLSQLQNLHEQAGQSLQVLRDDRAAEDQSNGD